MSRERVPNDYYRNDDEWFDHIVPVHIHHSTWQGNMNPARLLEPTMSTNRIQPSKSFIHSQSFILNFTIKPSNKHNLLFLSKHNAHCSALSKDRAAASRSGVCDFYTDPNPGPTSSPGLQVIRPKNPVYLASANPTASTKHKSHTESVFHPRSPVNGPRGHKPTHSFPNHKPCRTFSKTYPRRSKGDR
jgi:hypothetical protein